MLLHTCDGDVAQAFQKELSLKKGSFNECMRVDVSIEGSDTENLDFNSCVDE